MNDVTHPINGIGPSGPMAKRGLVFVSPPFSSPSHSSVPCSLAIRLPLSGFPINPRLQHTGLVLQDKVKMCSLKSSLALASP